MLFNVALKDVAIDAEVGRLLRTDRLYPCRICGKPTGWRVDGEPDCPGMPVCSDECLDVADTPSVDVSSGPTPPSAGSNTLRNGEEEHAGVVNLGSGVLLEIHEKST